MICYAWGLLICARSTSKEFIRSNTMYDLSLYNFLHIFRAQFDLARLDQSLHVKLAIMYYFKNLQMMFGDVP